VAKKPINKGFFESRQNPSRVVPFAAPVCKNPHALKKLYGIRLFHAVPICMLQARCISVQQRIRRRALQFNVRPCWVSMRKPFRRSRTC
jgi:hypothetical protein